MWRIDIFHGPKRIITGLSHTPSLRMLRDPKSESAIMTRIPNKLTKPVSCKPCKKEVFELLAYREEMRKDTVQSYEVKRNKAVREHQWKW